MALVAMEQMLSRASNPPPMCIQLMGDRARGDDAAALLLGEHIAAEKLKILRACQPLELDDTVTGQYVRCDSTLATWGPISNKESTTETFPAAVLHVHTPRWDGVPFVLKAGKALTDRKAEVRIQFHRVPGAVSALKECAANELVVRLQPEQTIYWKVINKVPGLKFQVQQMRMDLLYSNKFSDSSSPMPEAYERLLLGSSPPTTTLRLSTGARGELAHLHADPQRARRQEGQTAAIRIRFGRPAAADAAQKYGMSKFGGGITTYVERQPKKVERGEDHCCNTTSNSASAASALALAAASSLRPLSRRVRPPLERPAASASRGAPPVGDVGRPLRVGAHRRSANHPHPTETAPGSADRPRRRPLVPLSV